MAGVAFAAPTVHIPSREEVNAVMQELSAITGMPIRHELKFELISREQVEKYLDDRTAKSVKPAEIERERDALVMLGFVPRGFDLRKTTVDLMTEQAAAFYDYNKKALFLTDWAPVSMRDTAVVHELAHALADQNYHLGKYERKVSNDDEESTARDAVIEGQASYLMLAYAAAEEGKPPLGIRVDPATFDEDVAPTHGDYPVFDHAPLYMRMNLVFPYTWGMGFQAALVRRMGKSGFSEPFRHAPVSTRQIIHPEIYLEGESLDPLPLPKVPHGFKTIFEGELGELDHRVLIQQYASLAEAKRLSPEWRGGSFRVIENRRDRKRQLRYQSVWSDAAKASAFLGVYRKCVAQKLTGAKFEREDDQGFRGRSEEGYFAALLRGNRVDSIEDAAEPPDL